MFVKLFTQILDSSIADDRKLRHFFTDLLLCADCKGYIIMTPSAIARRIGASVEEVEWGIAELEKPDPNSKTKEDKGKRIEPLGKSGYGWRILNYETYRALKDADQMREATRRRVNRHREKKKVITLCNANVTPCNANTEADTDTKLRIERERESIKSKTRSLATASPLVSKINSINPDWAAMPVLSRKESVAYESNLESLNAATDAAWDALKAYYGAKIPQGEPSYRPKSREKLMADFPDVITYAIQWQRKNRPATPKPKPISQDDGEKLSVAEQLAILKAKP